MLAFGHFSKIRTIEHTPKILWLYVVRVSVLRCSNIGFIFILLVLRIYLLLSFTFYLFLNHFQALLVLPVVVVLHLVVELRIHQLHRHSHLETLLLKNKNLVSHLVVRQLQQKHTNLVSHLGSVQLKKKIRHLNLHLVLVEGREVIARPLGLRLLVLIKN